MVCGLIVCGLPVASQHLIETGVLEAQNGAVVDGVQYSDGCIRQ